MSKLNINQLNISEDEIQNWLDIIKYFLISSLLKTINKSFLLSLYLFAFKNIKLFIVTHWISKTQLRILAYLLIVLIKKS